jgi:hypothetical protein
VTTPADVLWLRAVRAAGARGLLPANRSPLTPGELAAEVARRGEDRLARLVGGWYYPASYGRISGMLSDEEAAHLVAGLEAEVALAQVTSSAAQPVVDNPEAHRKMDCELCGSPIVPIP